MSGMQRLSSGRLVASFRTIEGSAIRASITLDRREIWGAVSPSLVTARESALTFLEARKDLAGEALWIVDALAPVVDVDVRTKGTP